jgi:Dolichyl-phosphate-mannose-protein mannosyltransferase
MALDHPGLHADHRRCPSLFAVHDQAEWDSAAGRRSRISGAIVGRLRRQLSPEAKAVAIATVLFISLSIWWILTDDRLPGGGDPGRHLLEAIDLSRALEDGNLLAALTWESGTVFNYPPLVRTIGGVTELLGLPVHDWGPIVLNLIFVPVLAAGCYLTGRLVFGRLAGVLAAVFALGSPMILQLFHVYLIDAPLAAIVAIATWALLASDDFRRTRQAVLAGALIGMAMLVKTPAPIFLAGPIAVMLVRGGWRQGRNLALFAAAALIVAGPYYLIHLGEYVHLSQEATVGSTDPWTQMFGWTFEGERRFTLENLAWYGWAAINTQYLVPLLTLLAVGLISCVTQLRDRRHLPELLVGLIVGYLAMTMLSVHDARYTLPLVVFVSVIATGWIATASREWVGAAGIAILCGAVALNIAAGSLGWFSTMKLTIPGNDPNDLIHPGAFTIADKRGYVVGEPRPNSLWEDVLSAASADGLETATIIVLETPTWGTDRAGFGAMADQYGIQSEIYSPEASLRPDLVATMWWTSDPFYIEERGFDPPCAKIEEGIANPDNPDYPSYEGIPVSVLVERRTEAGQLERWCDFGG